MAFGSGEEVKAYEKKFYTGVENFKVTAVSPNKATLEALYGREIAYTPEYVGTTKVNDGDGEREVKQVRIDFFLTNDSNEAKINTRASFYIADTHHKSSTNKFKVINAFGEDSWLTEEAIKTGALPGNMLWYDATGVRVAKRGEAELIDFLKNLMNIAFKKTAVKPEDAYASIDDADWAKIFKGDFSPLEDMVASTNNKVGLVLGVKTATDNTMRQTVYTKKSLRQYVLHQTKADKYRYMLKDIQETQAGGGMAQIDFGPEDLLFREFSLVPTQLSLDNAPASDDVFGAPVTSEESSDGIDF